MRSPVPVHNADSKLQTYHSARVTVTHQLTDSYVSALGCVRVSQVWATNVRVQAIIKQNNTYYGIPMGQVIGQSWVRIETVCGVANGISKIGGQTGQGPDNPVFTEDFEIGYITQASGTGDNQNRHVIVDNWSVRVWR